MSKGQEKSWNNKLATSIMLALLKPVNAPALLFMLVICSSGGNTIICNSGGDRIRIYDSGIVQVGHSTKVAFDLTHGQDLYLGRTIPILKNAGYEVIEIRSTIVVTWASYSGTLRPDETRYFYLPVENNVERLVVKVHWNATWFLNIGIYDPSGHLIQWGRDEVHVHYPSLGTWKIMLYSDFYAPGIASYNMTIGEGPDPFPEALRGADVLVIYEEYQGEPYVFNNWCPIYFSFSQNEIQMVTRFVMEGGALYISSEYRRFLGERIVANDLLQNFSMRFVEGTVCDVTNNSGMDYWPTVHEFRAHSITQGMTILNYSAGCGIKILDVDKAEALAWADEDSWIDLPPSNGVLDPGEPLGNIPVLACSREGRGRVVIYGDTYGMPDDLFLRVIDWLSESKLDSLVNIGTIQTIWAMAEYENERIPFNSSVGILFMNGSSMFWSASRRRWEYNYTSNEPKTLTFVVSSVLDNLYGLSTFSDETGQKRITWTGLRIDGMSWSKDLANISDVVKVYVHLVYAHNMSPIIGGNVDLNGTVAMTNGTGWAIFSIVVDSPSSRVYMARGLRDGPGWITVAENNQSHRFVWTAIKVDYIGSNATISPINGTVRIVVRAVWAHNGTTIANALVELKGNSTMQQIHTNGSGYARFDLTASAVGEYLFNATGKEASGITKAFGWKSIRIRFGIKSQVNLCLKKGYNLISLPVLNESLTASSLLKQIGNASQSVFMFNASSGRFVSYDKKLVEFGIPQPDFSIEPNMGYFVYLSNDTTATIVGIQNVFARIIPLKKGYNLVGWTYPNCSRVKSAFMNFSFIDSAFAFNVTDQRYISYDRSVAEFGIPQPDFVVSPGEGYFVFANRDDILYYGGG